MITLWRVKSRLVKMVIFLNYIMTMVRQIPPRHLQPYFVIQLPVTAAFALELLPRISRAQSMDALSSQASCAGYQCGLIAAARCVKFFPMLTTAAAASGEQSEGEDQKGCC